MRPRLHVLTIELAWHLSKMRRIPMLRIRNFFHYRSLICISYKTFAPIEAFYLAEQDTFSRHLRSW